MHDGHPNVIHDHWKPERLFLDRGVGGADFIGELVTQANAPRLVPRERFRDVCLGGLPNE